MDKNSEDPTGVPNEDKLKVFVSYSRRDVSFADQIVRMLSDYGYDPILDRHDIDAAEEWKDRLNALIFSSDKVVFVLSDHSASSSICQWEVETAVSLGKPLIPVTINPLTVAPPDHLAALNYILFYSDPAKPGSGFYDGSVILNNALSTDRDWMRQQTRLMERAGQYARDPVEALLMRGEELQSALAWAQSAPQGHAVRPELAAYLATSEQAEENRKAEAQANLVAREKAVEAARVASNRVRTVGLAGTIVSAVLLAGALLVGWIALQGQVVTEQQRSDLLVQTSKMMTENRDHDLAILMALQADPLAQSNWLRRVFYGEEGFPRAQARLVAAISHAESSNVFVDGIRLNVPTNELVYAPDGKRLAILSDRRKTITLLDTETKEELHTFSIAEHDGAAARLQDVSWSLDSSLLAAASYYEVAVWNVETGERLHTIDVPEENSARFIRFQSDSERLVVIHYRSGVSFVDLGPEDTPSLQFSARNWSGPEAISTDGALVATLEAERIVHESGATYRELRIGIFDLETGEQVHFMEGIRTPPWVWAFSPDGRRLATATMHEIRTWDMERGQQISVLNGHNGPVTALSFFSDGSRLVSASEDTTFRIWDVQTTEVLRTYREHARSVGAIAYAPDGRHVASADYRDVGIWPLKAIMMTDPADLVGYTCSLLQNTNRRRAMSADDLQRYPVLRGERRDPETGGLLSLCPD